MLIIQVEMFDSTSTRTSSNSNFYRGNMAHKDYQGGKAYGELMKRREKDLDEINQQFLSSGTYDEV